MTYTIILGMSILREINFTSPLPPPFLLDRDKRWSRLTREIFVLRPILIRDRRNCKMHFFVRSSGSSGGRPRALKLDRINNVYANWWSPVHGETFLHLKVYNVTRYIYIYTYITASEFFFVFSFFFPGNFTLCGGKKGFVPATNTARWIFKNSSLPLFTLLRFVRWERKA